jgi:hypothetical protein
MGAVLVSAYNEVVRAEEEVCPRCESKIQRLVQFKYGDTWQHRYEIGDRIEWGGNDVGEPGHELVVAIGYPDDCPVCGYAPDRTYDVLIRRDVIEDVRPSDGTYDYSGSPQGYLVIEP